MELDTSRSPIILVGHSVGASILARCLAVIDAPKSVVGVFLLSAPFWGGEGWRYDGYEELELSEDVAKQYPKDARIFLYHCRDDGIVPLEHLALYAWLLPQATVREFGEGGHQFNNDLSAVAEDIRKVGKASR